VIEYGCPTCKAFIWGSRVRLHVDEAIVFVFGHHWFKCRSRATFDDAFAEACNFACCLRDGESAGGRVSLRDLNALTRPSLRKRRRKPSPDRPAIETARWMVAGASALLRLPNIRSLISRSRVAEDGLIFLPATANRRSAESSNQFLVAPTTAKPRLGRSARRVTFLTGV
jgi:hypothetical protein